ncbi:MAG TPA: glycosyltransferase family 39 protein [Pyrinomonadaceae bacterium]|jgi:4-amino-4-deoxy-L-arabinose transferase-like glycosyltransferase
MSEITKAKDQRPKTENRFIRLFFAFAIVAVYFFALGSFPLVGPDEPRYAQVAREMFERGDWLTPTLGGANWFEKPVLLYWLEIASYKIFGISEFAARFGSALCGLGTIASLYLLGKLTTGAQTDTGTTITKNQRPETEFARWLAVISASSVGLLIFSRGASFDIILTFPVTASLVCYFLFETYLQRHFFAEELKSASIPSDNAPKAVSKTLPIVRAYLFLVGFYFFVGLALLAKGLVGIVFPFAIVFFYHLLKRELLPGGKFLVSLIWGTILSLLVASVWYLPMYQIYGWTFVDEFFIQQQFQRYTSNKYQHPQPFYFFFLALPLMTLPWLPFFLASIWNFLKGFFYHRDTEKTHRKNKQLSTLHAPLSIFAFAWLLVPLVFFSFSGSKLPGYILPALPAAMILTARYVYDFARKSRSRKIALQISAFLTFVVAALLLQFYAPIFAGKDSVKSLVETANAKGLQSEKITNLFTVSHNAEFYAAGRLIRDADGKLKRYDDFLILVNDMKTGNMRQMLVLVPHTNTKDITESPLVESEILADNGDTAIVLVKPR